MNQDKTLLFLSHSIPVEMRQDVWQKSKNSMQNAAIALQDKLIAGFEENLKKPVSIFNLLPINRYPSYYADAFVKGGTFAHVPGARDYNVGFCNIAYIKRLLLKNTYLRQFRQYYKKLNTDIVVCYSTSIVGMAALKIAKKMNHQVQTCLIVPDMPEFNDLSKKRSGLFRMYDAWSARQTRAYFPYIDSFVYLTAQSAAYFCDEKPYVVMEGIAEAPVQIEPVSKQSEIKTIVYTGTTHAAFGVMNLVRAFEKIPSDEYRLVICGCGDSDEEIYAAAQKDPRIQFKGVVTREDALNLQQQATVLVNPRQNVGAFTKYSFPSKTMEYLASGVPVVAYKLDGIPEEYTPYLTYVKDNSEEALAETLMQVCQLDNQELLLRGCQARDFVLREKNAVMQTKKILSLFTE